MPTITLQQGNSSYTITTSTDSETALAQQIAAVFNASGAGLAQLIQTNPFNDSATIPVAASVVVAEGDSGATLTGALAIPAVRIILASGVSEYVTGSTAVSTVVVPDNVSKFVVNNNASGALLAVTGTALSNGIGDTLEGLAGANQFITGNGGRDAVLLDGASNSLTSNGNDVVLVGGPSTITAAAGGVDNITETAGTTLAFINQSNAGTVNTVAGAAGGIIVMAGAGSALVTAGAGQEYFFLDTSAGNTTINASGSTTAALTFIKDANVGTASILVNNFAPGGTVAVHGYSNPSVTQSSSNPNGSVLNLSDGSQVTFTGLSTIALQTAIRVV